MSGLRARVGQRRAALTGAAVLLAVFTLAATSVSFRPEGTDWSAWWPASGIAIGFAARIDRSRLWMAAAAMGAVSSAASLVNGRELPLGVWAGVAIAAEVWIGAAILRTRSDRPARLDSGADVVRLLVCALVSSVTVALVGSVVVAMLRGADSFLPSVIATVLPHAAGVLLIVPLIIRRRREPGAAGLSEAIAIWTTLAVIVAVTFGWNVGLPLGFLAMVPLIWAATRLAPRGALLLMLVIAIAANALSLVGRGPFAIGVLSIEASVLMVQLFMLSMAITSVTVVVLTARGRLLASTVRENEALFRAMFDFSPVSSAIIRKTATGPVVDQLNDAGRDVLGLSADDPVELSDIVSEESLAVFSSLIGEYGAAGVQEWRGVMTLRDGRSFDVLLGRLPSELDRDIFTVRFFDVTDRLRAQQAVSEELARAGEVQRALLPKDAQPLFGYEVAGACVPARTVGGDFYDWYRVVGGLAFSLGDVMGKGVGAGMIAATTRAALRSARNDGDATVAVARAADTLNTEVGEVDSFTTLFHARLRAEDGALEYVDAGHGLAVILRADGTADRIASTDMPLGIAADSDWTARHEVLEPGDTLVAISDGVLDLYGGTLAALDEIAELGRRASSASELTAMLSELAHQTAEPEDDSTILAIRRAVGGSNLDHRRDHDELTGEPNRPQVMDRLEDALAGAAPGADVSLLLIDLDSFGRILGALRREEEDAVLAQVAERLRSVTRRADTVARIGDDEFVILCDNTDRQAASKLAERVRAVLSSPLAVAGRSLLLTASTGMATARDGDLVADLIQRADASMDQAKRSGWKQSGE